MIKTKGNNESGMIKSKSEKHDQNQRKERIMHDKKSVPSATTEQKCAMVPRWARIERS